MSHVLDSYVSDIHEQHCELTVTRNYSFQRKLFSIIATLSFRFNGVFEVLGASLEKMSAQRGPRKVSGSSQTRKRYLKPHVGLNSFYIQL